MGDQRHGEVVRATDTKLLREVAIKKVHVDLDDETLARFQVEARIGGQLDHPGVLPVYDLDLDHDEHGTPFLPMKLVTDHRSLASIIDALLAKDEAAVAQWSYQRRVAHPAGLSRGWLRAQPRRGPQRRQAGRRRRCRRVCVLPVPRVVRRDGVAAG